METPIPVRLKAARKAAGLTQQQLGIALGMDPNTASARMNQYERGKHTPDYQTMQRIGKILGVPTAYFYCEDDILIEIMRLYSNLSNGMKVNLLDKLKANF
ncbi:helix-turn-helix domain-containing protein [Photobacterium leiognathi]|uniref:helix-turn-helix domain-containing protein n=1 Tax=Photobacterium leiognathi TaxID=553611 RepID=UPI002733A8F3|nr:helix-turn-helix transcriptional regulator [Photobacterium leiognathi]